MVMLCPEGVQNKCPGGGGVWCRGFMSWGDTLICVISRGVQWNSPIHRSHACRTYCIQTLQTLLPHSISFPAAVYPNRDIPLGLWICLILILFGG